MKVYIVYSNYYNGRDGGTNFKVFATEKAAREYMEPRKTRDGYYWDRFTVQEVIE